MLQLAPGLLDQLQREAARAAPDECCGLLGGSDGPTRRITAARPCRNVARAPASEFTAHPQDQLDAMRSFEAAGLEALGIYHSHPRGPPHPSPTDAARAAFPGWTYVVLWPGPGCGAWRWQPPRFVPEPI
ncbi:MAG: M67 family metallopeptidase [Halobacteriales archaeon]|nr:M67 family metallopeptidase [Halobacteriales archaeon]